MILFLILAKKNLDDALCILGRIDILLKKESAMKFQGLGSCPFRVLRYSFRF